MKKLSISFKVEVEDSEPMVNYEYFLKDLLETAVLPALSSNLVPLTLEVKGSRKQQHRPRATGYETHTLTGAREEGTISLPIQTGDTE